MIFIPIFCLIEYYIVFNIMLAKRGQKKRFLALISSVVFETFIVYISCEFLSIFHTVSYVSLAVVWGMVLVAGILYLTMELRKQTFRISSFFSLCQWKLISINTVTLFVCLTTVALALTIVPYNWDSMTYHLTRIVHWVQNGSVAHYVCHDLSQISNPPLAEFAMLHVYVLSHFEDYLVNMVQNGAFLISVLLVYKTAKKIGCNDLFSQLSALTYAVTPIVFGEALTTQVDVFAGLWLIMTAYLTVDFINYKEPLRMDYKTKWHLVLLGLSIGFSYSSKPSATVGAVVLVIWLFIHCIRRHDKAKDIFCSVLVTAIIASIVVFPELLRNIHTFRAIGTAQEFLIPSFTLPYLLVNFSRNVVFNLNNIYFDISKHGGIGYKALSLVLRLFTDESTLPGLGEFEFSVPAGTLDIDTALNPVITWLTVFAGIFGILYLIVRWKRKKSKTNISEEYEKGNGRDTYIFICIFASIVFFSIAKWYRFITRYEIGYFAILSPGVCLMFQKLLRKKEKLLYAFTGILLFLNLVNYGQLMQYHLQFVYRGTQEERIHAYFEVRGLYDDYSVIAAIINENSYSNVGIIESEDSYEYPLWKMVEQAVSRIEHVCVANETSVYEDPTFIPDCIVSVDVEPEQYVTCSGRVYEKQKVESSMSFYLPQS